MMIKKLIIPMLFAACTSVSAFAQINSTVTTASEKMDMEVTTDVDNDDYERLLDAYLRVSFREYAYNALDLSSEQIEDLDPLYMAYMKDRAELNDERERLMNEYAEERAEDDSVRDENEEAAEFVEDYWEVDIDEMRLRKETFDRMEDAIGYRKAFEFFMLEETIANRVNQERTIEYIPVLVDLDSPEMNYYREIDRYNTWFKRNKINIDGKTGLDHNYTCDGLMKITRTIKATVNAVDGDIDDLDTHIATIKEKTEMLKEDKYGNDHADAARAAFMTVATLMEEVAELDDVVVDDSRLEALRMAAEKIDPNTLYLEQSAHAYNFFDQAQQTLNNLYTKNTMSSSKMSSDMKGSTSKK